MSDTLMGLPVPAEKASVASSTTVWVRGTLLSGASLAAVTAMTTAFCAVWAPPPPVWPRSSAVMVRRPLPVNSGGGL